MIIAPHTTTNNKNKKKKRVQTNNCIGKKNTQIRLTWRRIVLSKYFVLGVVRIHNEEMS